MTELYDISAEELRPYVQLTDPQLRRAKEAREGILIAESPHVIESAIEADCVPLSFLGEEKKLARSGLMERFPNVPAYTMEASLLESLTGYAMTRGVLCAMERPAGRGVESVCANARRIAVLEGIVDASNLGAIFRSAAALGMDGILLSPDCCDPYCRKALRVSMGAVFRIPFARMDSWPEQGIELLHSHQFSVLGFALCRDAVKLGDPALKQRNKIALILGSEGFGIQPRTLDLCDQKVLIPMKHGVDSLNVAAAAAVAFWELSSEAGNEI